MWQRTVVIAGTVLMLLLTSGVGRAEESGRPADLARQTEKVRDLQEDILLGRTLGTLQLSNAQLTRLLPVLLAAQKRLSEQDAIDARELSGAQPGLELVRKEALAGRATPGLVEQKLQLTLQNIDARRKQLRAELVASIRRSLNGVATQEQLAQMTSAGYDLNTSNPRNVKLVPPAPGGGPPEWINSYMERLRQMPPDEWEQWKAKFNERAAQGKNPQRLEQDAYFMRVGEVVRGMPPQQFEQQKRALMDQAFRDFNRIREAGSESDYLNRFIDRCFLSPRIVPVIQEKTRAPGAG